MSEHMNDFEERKKDAAIQAYEKLELYRLVQIAQRLLQSHSTEELRGMTEMEVLDLCLPTKCDAADVVAMCIVVEEYAKSAIHQHLCS